jgi:hypothetical protein
MNRLAAAFALAATLAVSIAATQPTPEELAEKAVKEAQKVQVQQADLGKQCAVGNKSLAILEVKGPQVYLTTANLLIYLGKRLEAKEALWAAEAVFATAERANPANPEERDPLSLTLQVKLPKTVPGLAPGLVRAGNGWTLNLWHPQVRGLVLLAQELGSPLPPEVAAQVTVVRPKNNKGSLPWPPEWILLARKAAGSPEKSQLQVVLLRGTLQPGQPIPCAVASLEALKNLTALFTLYLEAQP